jgi:hypothetical protein
MRWLAIIIVACWVLAVLRVALIVLVVILALLILWGLLFRPAETVGAILLFVFLGLLEQHPVAVMLLVGVLAVASLQSRRVHANSGSEEPQGNESAETSNADRARDN